jgi:hypothetical protein
MHAPHNKGHLPGLGESLVGVPTPRGVVPEKSKRAMVESAALMAQHSDGCSAFRVFANPAA